MATRWEWDPQKRLDNLRKHGIDFVDAELVDEGPTVVSEDDSLTYGEQRWRALGWLHGVVVVLVFSQPEPEVTRVISLRKATPYEQRQYQAFLRDRLGESAFDGA
jgi:uncharacterized DUF497 family protein